VGKWAENPQIRMNTGFQRGHFLKKKWAESGQMATFLTKKAKNRPNNLQKSTHFFKKYKKAHFSKI